MSIIKPLDVYLDFTAKDIVSIPCTQYDKDGRTLNVHFLDNGKIFLLDKTIHELKFKMTKKDSKIIFNSCTINDDGTATYVLTEQTCVYAGVYDIQFMLINISDESVIHTMPAKLNISKTVADNIAIESSDEFDALNEIFFRVGDLEDLSEKLENLSQGIVDETTRAIAKEAEIETKLNQEITRATSKEAELEKTLSDKIDKTTIATSSTLGLVKSGSDVTVDASGNMSVNDNSHKHTVSNISDLTVTANELNVLDGITSTTEELNSTKGVTSNIQEQLNSKVSNERTVNGKSLSANINLTADDVGADVSGSAKAVQNNLDNHINNSDIHFTSEERTKLKGIAAGANKVTVDSTLSSTSTNPVQNKVVHSAIANEVTARDSAIATAKSSAISTAASDATSKADKALASAKSYTDTKTASLASTTVVDNKISTHNTSTSAHSDIRNLISELTTRLNALADSDDTTLDQMSEIVAYIKANKTLIDSVTTNKVNISDIVNNLTTNVSNKPLSAAQGVVIKGLINVLQSEVDSKANSTDLTSHTGNTSIHVTASEKTAWNNKSDFSGSYNDLTNRPTIPTKTSQLTNDSGFKTTDTVTTVTTTGTGNAITSLSATNGAITATKGSTFLTAHPTITKSTDSTSTASPSAGGTFTAIDSVTRDGNGHVTKVNTKTITLPNTSVVVDSALSSTSTNPVQNKVVNRALNEKVRRYSWTAITKGQTWSRICHVGYGAITSGSSFILSVEFTRGSTVGNATFQINTSHPKTCNIVQLNANNYSSFKIRGVADDYGNVFIEIYDSANAITSTTTQSINCSIIPIITGGITTYTVFTDGTTVPSGYGANSELTVVTDSKGAIVANKFVGNASTATTLTDLTTSIAELNYVKGVTSNIQTQLNNKSSAGHTHDVSYISGVLPVSKGGTGQANANSAANALMNALSIGESDPQDADYFISQYAGGGTTNTTYHRRPISALWNYIKSKLATVATSGSYNDLSNKPTIGNGTVTIKQAGTSKGTFTMNQSGNTTIELTDNNTTYGVATQSANGLESAADKKKLDGIATGAEVNQNAFSNVKVGETTIAADSKTDSLTLAGSNVTLTPDATNDKVTIGITKANVTSALGYTPPTTNTTYGVATSSTLGLVKSGTDITVDSSGNVSVNDDSHNHVISNVDGLQTALDGKAVKKELTSENLNDIKTPGFYNAGGNNSVTNKPSGIDHFGLYVVKRASGDYYTQILIDNNKKQYRRHCENGTWGSWAEDKLTDTNTTYSAGAGITLSGTTIKHSNSVTAATAQGDASKTLTFGGTFTIPTVTYDAQGHITAKGTTTMTMPASYTLPTATASVKGGVTLSDSTILNSTASSGVAATPSSVFSVQTQLDDLTTNIQQNEVIAKISSSSSSDVTKDITILSKDYRAFIIVLCNGYEADPTVINTYTWLSSMVSGYYRLDLYDPSNNVYIGYIEFLTNSIFVYLNKYDEYYVDIYGLISL